MRCVNSGPQKPAIQIALCVCVRACVVVVSLYMFLVCLCCTKRTFEMDKIYHFQGNSPLLFHRMMLNDPLLSYHCPHRKHISILKACVRDIELRSDRNWKDRPVCAIWFDCWLSSQCLGGLPGACQDALPPSFALAHCRYISMIFHSIASVFIFSRVTLIYRSAWFGSWSYPRQAKSPSKSRDIQQLRIQDKLATESVLRIATSTKHA